MSGYEHLPLKQMLKTSALFSLAVSAIVCAACSPNPRGNEGRIGGEWTSETEQRGDTTIVRTISGSVWGDSLHLVPEVEIGVLEGDQELMFGRISSLDVDAEGNIYVLDRQADQIRVFSPEGEHLMSIGRTGAAPGELSGPSHLRVTDDGRIVVREENGGRFSVFDQDGTYLEGWPRNRGYATTAPFYLNARGEVVNPTLPDQLVVYSLSGEIRDTLANPELGLERQQLRVEMNGGYATYQVPFSPSPIWSYTRDGHFISGASNSYAIDLEREGGSVLRIERSIQPISISSDEASDRRESLLATIRRNNNATWEWNGPDIPSTKPFFSSLQSGVDGTIWVFRQGASVEKPNPYWDPDDERTGNPYRWVWPISADVFDADGRYLGPVAIPENVGWSNPRPVLSAEWLIAATTHDEGYPQVVRYLLKQR